MSPIGMPEMYCHFAIYFLGLKFHFAFQLSQKRTKPFMTTLCLTNEQELKIDNFS